MRAMSCVEASDDLEAAIAQVVDDCTPIAITRERGEGAVLVSASASIEDTWYLLHAVTSRCFWLRNVGIIISTPC